jgi:Domain of unknown function (DUF4351)
LFSNLKSNLEANQPVDQEEEDLVLRLSPIYLEQIQEAEQRGEQIGESRLIIKLLQRRFGVISADVTKKISALPVDQLEVLGGDLFGFSDAEKLVTWLTINS